MKPNIQNNVIMNWKFITQPLGDGDISGGYAQKKKRVAWVVPAIMAAGSLASTIFGGNASAKANERAQKELAAEKARMENERRRKLNENYIDTAAGQNMMRVARQEADKIWRREAGAAAVSGSTERSAMAKEYGNNLVGDAIANIAANDTARKDRIDENYNTNLRQLSQQQIGLDQQQGQWIANAAGQLASTFGNAAVSYLGAEMYGNKLQKVGQ